MDHAMDTAIADFARRLVPEAFARRTTAYGVEVVEQVHGHDAFATWIDGCLRSATQFEYPFGGHLFGLVVVESDGQRWQWDREPCCELGWLTGRVQQEVADFDEPWVFVANTPGPAGEWVEIEVQDGVYEEVYVTPTPRWEMPWYAEARGRGVARIRTGLVVLDEWEVVGHRALSAHSTFERDARRVLRGHPARRRHRLR